MKYKKHIATGALALSLLVSGSSVFASSPRDLGIKNTQPIYQKQGKDNKNLKIKHRRSMVGNVLAITNTGFTMEIKNMKTKTILSFDVKIDPKTVFRKNGKTALASDLTVGQKIIVAGGLDKTTNTINAKIVKIVIKTANIYKNKKGTN